MAWFFHYTSHAHVQAMRRSGRMRPGVSGKVFLTPDLYDQGCVAADRLSTDHAVPRQMLVAFDQEAIENLDGVTELMIGLVEPIYLGDALYTTGGGHEVTISAEVPVTDVTLVLRLRDP